MIIGSRIVFIESLPSTNTYASELIRREEAQEGTIIRAGYQSAGRGQPGNRWESEAGKNLLFSIILYPGMITADQQFVISMALSLGICDFVRSHATSCKVKWPNDIYVEERKIAGILIENTIFGNSVASCVAGIGLNLNQTLFAGISPAPVSMAMITGKQSDPATSLIQIAGNLDDRYKQLLLGEYQKITGEYIDSLYRYNEWCSFDDDAGSFTGRIVSVTGQGLLVVEKENGEKREYGFREVRLSR